MSVGIVDRQSLGGGGGVEVLIRRVECHRGETGILVEALDFKGYVQLDGIVGSETVFTGGEQRAVEEGCG